MNILKKSHNYLLVFNSVVKVHGIILLYSNDDFFRYGLSNTFEFFFYVLILILNLIDIMCFT
jgi:hypothetical protein